MSSKPKQLSSPSSTGGGGVIFETRVQTAFTVLMLSRGFSPCLPSWPISKIKLQGKYAGYDTDDLIVFVNRPNGNHEAKLIAQIKSSVSIVKGKNTFGEVIQAAWNDFNASNFDAGKDAIALITGPLSRRDMEVRDILEWARHSNDDSEFLDKVEMTKFSSKTKRKKLEVLRTHLNNANGGTEISDEQLWRFLKSYNLLVYDLDIQAGVTHSLLHSLIGQYSPDDVKMIWALCLDEVQSVNQNAGTITFESLSEELQSKFQKKVIEKIPDDFVQTPSIPEAIDLNQTQSASELAIANLLGSWNEKFVADKAIAKRLTNEEFNNWILKIREILQKFESPLTLKNGKWAIVRRLEMWQTLGPRIFDDHLDRFQQCVIDVLTESDPQFELPPEERYAASIHDKVLTHSHSLRKGLAESLALLGSHPKALTNCSNNKPETTAVLSVREVFNGADWVRWASLNNLLPLLAESNPRAVP